MKNQSPFEISYANRETFLSMTSLYPEEFDHLLRFFRPLWYKFYKYRTTVGKRRKSKFYKYKKLTPTLPTVEDKLFFILVYMKSNPLQTFQAVTFGLSQSRVSRWVSILQPLLTESLNQLNCLPLRSGFKLEQALNELQKQIKDAAEKKAVEQEQPLSKKQQKILDKPLTVNQDGMEQRVNRKLDNQAQKKEYSGKKKDHTYKNQVNCLDNQLILFFSHTYLGSVHDKKIADQEGCTYPDDTRLRQDLGYQGYTPSADNAVIIQPFKKPYNGELTTEQKWFNTYLGQRRIVVEHAISGCKRCRIIKERCRLSYRKRDEFAITAAALHNFRVQSPLRAYDYHEKIEFTRVRA